MPAAIPPIDEPAQGAAELITGGFVHLHLHSEYSLLDGGNRLDKLIARVQQLGMNAVAVTDHGNLFGAAAFYQACKEHGVLPILGVEAYVTPPGRPRSDRTFTGVSDGGYHLVLLAENDAGWRNLLVLCSEAYLSGFYFKPRVDRELLEKHAEGLIAISGHLGSEIGEHLLAYESSGDEKHWERARESAEWHKKTFGEGARQQGIKAPSLDARLPRCLDASPGFFLELQHHVAAQNGINKHTIRLSRELGVPLVCDNDSHFLRAEDHDAHDTLICISMGKVKTDPDRLRYPREVYVKSPEEMRSLFEGEYGEEGREACDNTVRIAERCAGKVSLPLGANHLPMVRVKLPEAASLPRAEDAAFAGDLTAWYAAYCAKFEVIPFTIPAGADEAERARLVGEAKRECDAALRMLAQAGFVWRYGNSPEVLSPEVLQDKQVADQRRGRLDRELRILADKNIAAYFLIVWDFVNWGRQRGIPANARGSGVGTMVGYVLGLSNACPEQYGLLFERFTDPDRSEFPDIDIDLCQDGRAEVINYVRRKYGHVAQIITFGTLKARAAIRDVARVLAVSLPAADRIAKLVPEQLNITLDDALEQEPDLRALYEGKVQGLDRINKDLPPAQRVTPEQARALIDNARTIEGQARHASVHAAGVIVATRPLHEIVPLYKQPGSSDSEIVTQWDGPTCEKVGLLKMDFLGLRTLSVIERAKRLIRETLSEEEIWNAVGRAAEFEQVSRWRGEQARERTESVPSPAHLLTSSPAQSLAHPLDLDRLSFDDPRVFELFQRADTAGVFQFESGGMRRLLIEMKPDRLEDLIAANALFRPGPMDLIPDYNRRKHGQAVVPRVHEIVDRFTRETYGVMVYQEQVMQIVHGLGGIGLRDAYSLIKNISKKKHDKIDKERPKFVKGAQQQGLTAHAAEELFELILKFAGYGFNKSHSTGYAIVAYQTAYLKTYFPNQYMAAFLTYESGAQKAADWAQYVEDCRKVRFANGKVGVEVRPPDVNLSAADFTVVFDPGEARTALNGHIRFGLGAIKGVGEKAIEAIIAERDKASLPFTSLFDFCERLMARAGTGSGGAVLNKTTLEALVKCGAMDSLHPPDGRHARAAMLASIEPAMSAGQKHAADKAAGQGGLFLGGQSQNGALGAPKAAAGARAGALVKATPWTEAETLAYEKDALGFYISSHPLERWRAWTGVFTTSTCAQARTLAHDQRVVLAGLVQGQRTLICKSGRSAGQKMGIITLEDSSGVVEAVLFADPYAQFAHLLATDAVVYMLGRVDRSRAGAAPRGRNANGTAAHGDELVPAAETHDGVQIIVDRVVPIEGVPLMPGRLWLRFDAQRLNGEGSAALAQVAEAVRRSIGATSGVNGTMPDRTTTFPVDIVVDTAGARVRLETPGALRVTPTPSLIQELTGVLGESCVRVVGGLTVEIPGARSDKSRYATQRAG